jgi:hypothetical protein
MSLTYEVGKVYTFSGDIQICLRGFHFCEKLSDVIRFYAIDKDIVVFEVEALGKILSIGAKTVTDKIRIVRQLDEDESEVEQYIKLHKYEYDEHGNLIHHIDSNEFERWYKYDEHGNRTYLKNSNIVECWYDL